MNLAPNPVRAKPVIKFSLKTDPQVSLILYDINGRELKNLYSGKVVGGTSFEVEFNRKGLMEGCICRLTISSGEY